MLSVYDDAMVKSKINNLNFVLNFGEMGTSLVVQWLRLCAPNAGARGLIPGQGTKAHMLQPKISHAAMKIEDPMCCN